MHESRGIESGDAGVREHLRLTFSRYVYETRIVVAFASALARTCVIARVTACVYCGRVRVCSRVRGQLAQGVMKVKVGITLNTLFDRGR